MPSSSIHCIAQDKQVKQAKLPKKGKQKKIASPEKAEIQPTKPAHGYSFRHGVKTENEGGDAKNILSQSDPFPAPVQALLPNPDDSRRTTRSKQSQLRTEHAGNENDQILTRTRRKQRDELANSAGDVQTTNSATTRRRRDSGSQNGKTTPSSDVTDVEIKSEDNNEEDSENNESGDVNKSDDKLPFSARRKRKKIGDSM